MFNEYDPNAQNGNYSYHQGGNPPPRREDRDGSTAQVLGILSLVLQFIFVPVVSIVLGALAMHYAKRSLNILHYETREAKTGRICGLIGVLLGVIGILLITVLAILMFIGLALVGYAW